MPGMWWHGTTAYVIVLLTFAVVPTFPLFWGKVVVLVQPKTDHAQLTFWYQTVHCLGLQHLTSRLYIPSQRRIQGGGWVLGVATPPFIYGNAPSSAQPPLPFPYRAWSAGQHPRPPSSALFVSGLKWTATPPPPPPAFRIAPDADSTPPSRISYRGSQPPLLENPVSAPASIIHWFQMLVIPQVPQLQ